MIKFKMNVLSYNNNGSYTVEYIPESNECTPIKLNVQVNVSTAISKDEILTRLKNSAPQDYWMQEIDASSHSFDFNSLVNTSHEVQNIGGYEVVRGLSSPVEGFGQPVYQLPESTREAIINGELPAGSADAVYASSSTDAENTTATSAELRARVLGRSTPETLASYNEQQKVKLKLLIQQVIEEMADGTI